LTFMIHVFLAGRDAVSILHQRAHGLGASHPAFAFRGKRRDNPGGFIVDTLHAVFQAFFDTDNFEDCLIDVVNRGGDADTTGAIAGMLAGARYGLDAIPVRWLRRLDRGVAESCRLQAEALLTLSAKGPAPERIRGD
ncbi:MAG TPA: ADP-ribosylglycohydrolase family protein, partial [Rhodocyclaceae bacterium]|nr:ADP-ribosylglycohydrolase family protein [Rhodocyclaceae bacterium]